MSVPVPDFTAAELELAMPVTYYSQLMTVAYGGTAKEAGLDGHVIAPTPLTAIAERKVK